MNLKKKLNILLISVLGMSTVLALIFVGFLALQRNLAIPKVQASPGSTCTVNDTLAITGNRIRFTGTDGAGYSWISRSDDDSRLLIGWDGNRNTVIPNSLVVSKYWDFSSWDGAGDTADFTLDTTYNYALVAIQIDAQTDWEEIMFYDGAGGTGNQVASTEWHRGHFDWPQGQMHLVLVPTSAKSVKIRARGGFGGEQWNMNMVLITYVP